MPDEKTPPSIRSRLSKLWRRNFATWLYDHRSWLRVWVCLAFSGIALAVGGFLLLWNFDWESREWFKSPGPWTVLILLAGAPPAWFVWLVRDRNQDRQLVHDSITHAWEIFRELEQWATGDDVALKAAAIFQLRPFLFGKAEGPVPRQAVEGANTFFAPSLAIIRTVLDDRSWERKWEQMLQHEIGEGGASKSGERKKQPQSPVKLAIEAILTDPELPAFDMSRWNFSGLNMPMVAWNNRQLSSARFAGTILWGAGLQGADLFDANLIGADLSEAELGGASLSFADFRDADLTRANLRGVDLFDADFREAKLSGASLSVVELSNANLENCVRPENDIPGWRADGKGRLHRIAPDTPESKQK